MKKVAFLGIFLLALYGCATLSQNYQSGIRAQLNKKWDEAIQYFEKASLENPKEPVYRLALERAKSAASLSHLQEARTRIAQGKKEEAKTEYAKALSYDPGNTAIAMEAQAALSEKGEEAKPQQEKIEFPIKLKTKEDTLQLKFLTETSLRSIFLALGKSAGISIVFDENFRDVPFATDLTNMTLEQALGSLSMASRNFYRIIDERAVIIVPDLPLKRLQYEVNAIKTFYLSNVKAQDIMTALAQMLRSPVRTPNISFDKDLNSITIRDTPQMIEMAGKLIRTWDKPKGEIIIDLEIMEVNRTKLRQLGVSLDQNILGLRYGEPPADSTQTSSWFNLKNLNLSKAENFLINLPISYLQFLESDTDTKIIAQPRLRGMSGEEINHKVGQKIPIPRTTFSPYAAGGVSQQPITNFEQQDVGIEVKIKPKLHFEKEVTLELEIKLTSLGGKGYADIPIINNREIKNVMRLKDGETSLIAGLLRDEERKSIRGIPGLKDIPLLGRLFGAEDTTIEQTDVILTITPYIVRSIPLSVEDGKPLWVELERITSSTASPRDLRASEYSEVPAGLPPLQREPPKPQSEEKKETGENRAFLEPPQLEIPPKGEFRINIILNCSQEVANMSLSLNFNPQVLRLKDVTEGGLIRQLGEKVPFLKSINSPGGMVTIGFTSPDMAKGVKGAGSLAVLVFEAANPGESALSVTSLSANSPKGTPVSFKSSGAKIIVR